MDPPTLKDLAILSVINNGIKYDRVPTDIKVDINLAKLRPHSGTIRTNRGFIDQERFTSLMGNNAILVDGIVICVGKPHVMANQCLIGPSRRFRRLNALLIHDNITAKPKYYDAESVIDVVVDGRHLIVVFHLKCGGCGKLLPTELLTNLCLRCVAWLFM